MLTKTIEENNLICSCRKACALLIEFLRAKTRTWVNSLSSTTDHAELISASINYENNKAFCRAF